MKAVEMRDLTTDEIESLLARMDARIRQAAPEVKNVYLEPHAAPLSAPASSN